MNDELGYDGPMDPEPVSIETWSQGTYDFVVSPGERAVVIRQVLDNYEIACERG